MSSDIYLKSCTPENAFSAGHGSRAEEGRQHNEVCEPWLVADRSWAAQALWTSPLPDSFHHMKFLHALTYVVLHAGARCMAAIKLSVSSGFSSPGYGNDKMSAWLLTGFLYHAEKVCMAAEWRKDGIVLGSTDLGWVQTDLSSHMSIKMTCRPLLLYCASMHADRFVCCAERACMGA